MKSVNLFLVFALLIIILSNCQKSPDKKSPVTELTPDQRDEFIKQGQSIAMATFGSLSSHLQRALSEGGVAEALSYCQLNAIPITDSLSRVHQASIKRTSLKLRNPENRPSKGEEAILNKYDNSILNGEPVTPIVEKSEEGYIHFYAPIFISEFCLQCHGKVGETLTGGNYSSILNAYQNDKAIGYETGDLRGIWSIEFKQGG